MAWCRIHGPLPILRADYHAAQIAALIHNSNLSEKTSHKAKGIADFLLWGDKPDDAEVQITRAMSKLGIKGKRRNGDK
jgi:hypothetical protein